ncbi:TetR family transcriptional regulator [Actinokineospora spheciospongiae]|nr:TetR family transcriptional regulator [Actinokineospora spheciospongiae]
MASMAEPHVREKLVTAALDLLAHGGPDAVQARKVAAEVGASTMAVYTHFGNMGRLVDAIAAEGFRRLGARLDAVARTDDPMADLTNLGLAYRAHAQDNPDLYRVMFGVTSIGGHRPTPNDPTTAPDDPDDVALGTFGALTDAVEAVIAAGLIRPVAPARMSAQLWSALHGFVLLEIAGFHGTDGVERVLAPMMMNLLAGAGYRAGP